MNSKILLSMPEEKSRTKISQFLTEHGFEVDVAESGKEAQIKIYKNKYYAVILDLDTQDYPCMQVLKYVKLNFSALKVIMTIQDKKRLDDMNLDLKLVKKMGVNDIFIEPFPTKFLLKALEGNRAVQNGGKIGAVPNGTSEEHEVRMPDSKFSKIPMDDFYSGNATIFDVYIRLEKNRFMRVLQRGEQFNRERIEKHRKEKNTEFIHFLSEDRLVYINFLNSVLENVLKAPTVPLLKKFTSIKSLIEQYVEEVYTGGLKPQLVEEGKKICQNLYGMLEKEKGLAMLLKGLDKFPNTPYTHLALTTIFSAALIRTTSWVSGSTVQLTLMGAMLHDVGLVKISPRIAYKSQASMSESELAEYKKHPELGRDMLAGTPGISEPIRQIVSHHHEMSDSSGFPNGYGEGKIYPPAKIVSLANYYVDFFIESELSPLQGMQKFMATPELVKKFNPELVKSLITCFAK